MMEAVIYSEEMMIAPVVPVKPRLYGRDIFTARQLKHRCLCIANHLYDDFENAAHLDAHKTGGRVVCVGPVAEYKVAVIDTGKELRTLAIRFNSLLGEWERVKSDTELEYLEGHALIKWSGANVR